VTSVASAVLILASDSTMTRRGFKILRLQSPCGRAMWKKWRKLLEDYRDFSTADIAWKYDPVCITPSDILSREEETLESCRKSTEAYPGLRCGAFSFSNWDPPSGESTTVVNVRAAVCSLLYYIETSEILTVVRNIVNSSRSSSEYSAYTIDMTMFELLSTNKQQHPFRIRLLS